MDLSRILHRPLIERASEALTHSDSIIKAWSAGSLLANGTTAQPRVLNNAAELARDFPFLAPLLGEVYLALGLLDEYRVLHSDLKETKRPSISYLDILEACFYDQKPAQVAAYTNAFAASGCESYLYKAFQAAITTADVERAETAFLRTLVTGITDPESISLIWLQYLGRQKASKHFAHYESLLAGALSENCPAMAYAAVQMAVWEEDLSRAKHLATQTKLKETAEKKRLTFLIKFLADLEHQRQCYSVAADLTHSHNSITKRREKSGRDIYAHIEQLKAIPTGDYGSDKNANHPIITGFPRSGTTLLDAALSMHPEIFVCEETSAFTKALVSNFEFIQTDLTNETQAIQAAVQQRQVYYSDLRRLLPRDQQKRVVVDKTPILSVYADFLRKVYQGKKFIFLIRHPYDVVLSNYWQSYTQNRTMAKFNSLHDAAEYYDFTMTTWFGNYSIRDEVVLYVWYEELVEDFHATVCKVLAFCQLQWVPEIEEFAEGATRRVSKTPSYEKVRKGLSIGVQTSYQNYLFLFDDYCRSKLDPWVEFFGYTVEEPMT